MAEFTLSEEINCTPSELFDILVMPDKMADLVPYIRKVEKMTAGSIKKGTSYRQFIRHGGQEYESFVEVTKYERPLHYQVSVTQQEVDASYSYSLMASSQGTRIIPSRPNNRAGPPTAPGMDCVAQKMKQRDAGNIEKVERIR